MCTAGSQLFQMQSNQYNILSALIDKIVFAFAIQQTVNLLFIFVKAEYFPVLSHPYSQPFRHSQCCSKI